LCRTFLYIFSADQTGIVGLDDALQEMAEEGREFSDQKIGSMLVQKLSQKTILLHLPSPLMGNSRMPLFKYHKIFLISDDSDFGDIRKILTRFRSYPAGKLVIIRS